MSEYKGRFPGCFSCEGRGAYPCTVCNGGDPDCDRCDGTDQETCAECEHTAAKQRDWRNHKTPQVIQGEKAKRGS